MRRQTPFHPVLTRKFPFFRRVFRSLLILAAVLSPEICLAQAETAKPETAPAEKKEGVMVRMVCIQSLTGKEEEAVLATKTEDGKWMEHGAVTLRSPFITPWLRVPRGTTHLVRKNRGETVSLGSFLIPQNSKSSIVLLFPDTGKNIYRTQVIDPGNLGFQKGKVLIVNYGSIPAMLQMGKTSLTVNPGKQVVETINTDKDGMYRLMIAHMDKDQKIVPCYDRFVSSDPQTRKFILLFPDPKSGLRAMSLSEFGPFE
jgi:hypothetical protein